MEKIILGTAIVILITSCQSKMIHSTPTKSGQAQPEIVLSHEAVSPLPTQPSGKAAQFGILFSEGGVRAWAYVNILKEMQKYKLPIVSVAGMEWGSVVAGIFAQNLSANEVEWELSKFKDINDWSGFVKKIFEKKSTDALKVPFACSSLNLKNQTSYVLNKGQLDNLIPFCVPSAGVTNPYSDSIASMSEVMGLVQFLKQNGATKIILINAVSNTNGKPLSAGLQSVENQFWIQAASLLVKKNLGIDEVIDVDVKGINVEHFDRRRDIVNASIPQAKDQIKKIANKYGY